MGIFRILLQGYFRAKQQQRENPPSPRQATPLHSVRRTYLFLGEGYSVRVVPSERNTLKIKDTYFEVSLHPMTRENYETFIDNWYRRQARKAYEAALDRWLPLMAEAGYVLSRPRLKIFRMRRAWGRCYYTKNLITLNIYLVKTPIACIDYIVLHELCHLVEHSHSARFHALVARFLPEWPVADAELKAFARTHRVIV